MDSIDYKKLWKPLYAPSAKLVSLIDVPSHNYLMIDGKGDPNTSPAYAAAVEALYSVSYALKFMVKKGPQQIDFGVMPLEGLWWAEDMSSFTSGDKSAWSWTMMILQPELIHAEMVEKAIADVRKKKTLPALTQLRFEAFCEGLCAQILHIGPFSEEGQTVDKLHQFIADQGVKLTGKHHEIYLSNIHKAAPEKWKTIIRQPYELLHI